MTERESKPTTVAVVMATFNRAHLISQAIESLLGQTRPPDEFIVVNDGSTDDTAETVGRYGDRIKYLEQANAGKPVALNLALPLVESTYVWIFDDDDVALPNALETHLNYLSEHPECDFTYSTNYVFSGEFAADALEFATLKPFPEMDYTRYFMWVLESPFLRSLLQGMLIPTRCYRTVGGFDESLLRGQDLEMILRIARVFRGGFVKRPTFAERVHAGARGPNRERHAEGDRYRIWRQYKVRIFKKMRASLSLEEYLPGSSRSDGEARPMGTIETRQALLQRGLVMAIHGLFREAAEDFHEYSMRVDSRSAGPGPQEREQVSKMTYVHDPDAVPPARYYRALGALCRRRPALFRAAVRGLYWSFSREVRRRHAALALRLLGLGMVMATARYVGALPAGWSARRECP